MSFCAILGVLWLASIAVTIFAISTAKPDPTDPHDEL